MSGLLSVSKPRGEREKGLWFGVESSGCYFEDWEYCCPLGKRWLYALCSRGVEGGGRWQLGSHEWARKGGGVEIWC